MGPMGSVLARLGLLKEKKHQSHALKERKNKPWAGTMNLSEQKGGNKPTQS